MSVSRLILFKIKSVSDKFVEKIKTRILCSKNFFSENCAAFEIMWENMVEPERPSMTIYSASALHAV
jgi:hypothetical protein